MKISKIFSLSLIIYFTGQPFFGFNQNDGHIFYRDTIVEFFGYSFEFKNNFSHENLFKTEVSINNVTDKFLRIDPKNILLVDDGGMKVEGYYDDDIIVAPHYSKKIRFKFDIRSASVHSFAFSIEKIE